MDIGKLSKELEQNLDPSEVLQFAISLGSAGQYQEAILMYDVYLLMNPWSVDGLNNKADCLLALDRLDEAREYVTRALTMDPSYPYPWCTLAEIQVKQKEYFCAKLNFRISLKLAGPAHKSYPITLSMLERLEAMEAHPES